MSVEPAGTRRGRGAGVSVVGYSRTRRVNQPERGKLAGTLPAPIPESALYPVVAKHFAGLGFSCWRDVSFLGSWIDLHGKDSHGNSVSIELKVTDWKRALKQAVRTRNSAHQTYVALWAPYVHRAVTSDAASAFAEAGVGLLSVNGLVTVRIPAPTRTPRYPAEVVLPRRSTHRPR